MSATGQTRPLFRRYTGHVSRYYFSLENGHPVSDEDGEELVDDTAARTVALEIARDLARNNRKTGSFRVIVRAADDRIVYEVPLKKAG